MARTDLAIGGKVPKAVLDRLIVKVRYPVSSVKNALFVPIKWLSFNVPVDTVCDQPKLLKHSSLTTHCLRHSLMIFAQALSLAASIF